MSQGTINVEHLKKLLIFQDGNTKSIGEAERCYGRRCGDTYAADGHRYEIHCEDCCVKLGLIW